MKEYQKNGRVIRYNIQRKSIKNTYFRLRDGMLFVTTNHRTKEHLIESYIDQKFDFMYDKIKSTQHTEPDMQIQLWGHTYELDVTYGRFHYEIEGETLYLKTTLTDIAKMKKRLYGEELKKKLEDVKSVVLPVITSMSIEELPIRIKYLKSKFGSYHRKHHEITLNSFLARLDTVYLKYVIFHEYAHVIEFNHSKAFYQLLDQLMPDHRVYQKDLKKIAIH